MPVFNNLLNLSIERNKKKGWQVMPLLLKSCPHLHTLLLKVILRFSFLLILRVFLLFIHCQVWFFQGLVHRVTDKCGDACACPPNNKHKNKSKVISCLWTCQVKVLEILEYGGSFQELKQMRHFLVLTRTTRTTVCSCELIC